MIASPPLQIRTWPIDKFVFYARNPRNNDAAVDRMRSSIREFGFKIPVLARSDGEVWTATSKQAKLDGDARSFEEVARERKVAP